MRGVLTSLLLIAALTGCMSRSKLQQESAQASPAEFRREASQPAKGITVVGPVKNPNVPWVAGLTLAQAIATAEYIGSVDPKQIIITRQGESATLDARNLLNGKDIPLEIGDVIELH
jgi:hypothetical protein